MLLSRSFIQVSENLRLVPLLTSSVGKCLFSLASLGFLTSHYGKEKNSGPHEVCLQPVCETNMEPVWLFGYHLCEMRLGWGWGWGGESRLRRTKEPCPPQWVLWQLNPAAMFVPPSAWLWDLVLRANILVSFTSFLASVYTEQKGLHCTYS